MKRAAVLAAVLLAACDNQEECAQLEAMQRELEVAVAALRARADLADRIQANRDRAKARVEEATAALQLDQPEEAITEQLTARADRLGLDVERSTRQTQDGPPGDPSLYETVWNIDLPDRRLEEIFPLVDELAASPPLTRLSLITRSDDGWRMELMRAVVPQVPIKFEPKKSPPPPDPTTVESRPGFCGAARLRKQVNALVKEYNALSDGAAATSVALPEQASYKGLLMRTETVVRLERGARAVVAAVLQAAVASRLDLRAVGVEENNVILEIAGPPRVRGRLERNLPPPMTAAIEELPAPKDQSVVRLLIRNPAAAQGPRAEPESEGSTALGLPPLQELRQQLEQLEKEGPAGAHQHDHGGD
jgi:hypothetical protein